LVNNQSRKNLKIIFVEAIKHLLSDEVNNMTLSNA
jgi:hypothetical protein